MLKYKNNDFYNLCHHFPHLIKEFKELKRLISLNKAGEIICYHYHNLNLNINSITIAVSDNFKGRDLAILHYPYYEIVHFDLFYVFLDDILFNEEKGINKLICLSCGKERRLSYRTGHRKIESCKCKKCGSFYNKIMADRIEIRMRKGC